MSEENAIHEHLVKFCPIIDQLLATINAAHEAFTHQHSRFLLELKNHDETLWEIASALQKMRKLATESPEEGGKVYLKLHSILAHLKTVSETIGRLGEALREQIRGGAPLSDEVVDQINRLFAQQEAILRSLAEAFRNGHSVRERAIEECQNLIRSCLQFADEHELRMAEGRCLPQNAPLVIGILEWMETMFSHELEVAKLLYDML